MIQGKPNVKESRKKKRLKLNTLECKRHKAVHFYVVAQVTEK